MGKLLLAGVQLMVFGMGMVYVFLIIMIGCMKLMHWIIAPIAAKQQAAAEAAAAQKSQSSGGDEALLAAAAVAAVAAETGNVQSKN